MTEEAPRGFKVICSMAPRVISTLNRPDMSRPIKVEDSHLMEARLLRERDDVRMRSGCKDPEYNRLSFQISLIRHPEKLKKQQEQVRTKYACDDAYRENMLNQIRDWRHRNPDKVIAYYEKRRINPNYKGKVFVRNLIVSGLRMRRTVHGRKVNRARFLEYVGCTLDDFHKHIEAQFQNGMTWANRGVKWCHRFRRDWYEFDCVTEEGKKGMAHFSNIKVMEIVGALE